MGFDLSRKGNDIIIFRFISLNAGLRRLHIRRLQKERHTTGEFPLNGTGSGSNAVFDAVFQQQIPQRKAMLVISKENVVAKFSLSH